MAASSIRVLLIEDSDGDAALIQEFLESRTRPAYAVERTASLAAGLARLREGAFDVLLLDLDLPDSRRLATFFKAQSAVRGIPIVVLTGHEDETLAIEAVERGAQDYLVKGRVDAELLERSIRYAISRHKTMEELRQDITERKRAEREILDISEREQCRIGQELHDSMGQHLTGTAMLAKALERKLAAHSVSEASDAARIAQLLGQAIDEIQKLAHSLYPVHLDTADFPGCLRDLASMTEALFSVSCHFESDTDVLVSDPDTAIHLYRIVQEAISNSVRHGGAGNIWVSLTRSDDRNSLAVRDDGTGLPGDVASAKGMGLRIMRHRADTIGASLEVGLAPGGGTLVRVEFPGREAEARPS
jgi:signal transduction histidine kinase